MSTTKGSRKFNVSLTKLTVTLAALSVLSTYTTYLLYSLVQQIGPNSLSKWQGGLDVDTFTFIGDDFPDYIPIELDTIQVEKGMAWPPISMSFDEADSSYRFGPQNRTFAIAMFHELHCLEYLEDIVAKDNYPPVDLGHAQHCFSFLRQWTLCEPDLTLEPGDFFDQVRSRNVVTSNRTCRNWDVLYRHTTQNYRHWADFTAMQGWKFTE